MNRFIIALVFCAFLFCVCFAIPIETTFEVDDVSEDTPQSGAARRVARISSLGDCTSIYNITDAGQHKMLLQLNQLIARYLMPLEEGTELHQLFTKRLAELADVQATESFYFPIKEFGTTVGAAYSASVELGRMVMHIGDDHVGRLEEHEWYEEAGETLKRDLYEVLVAELGLAADGVTLRTLEPEGLAQLPAVLGGSRVPSCAGLPASYKGISSPLVCRRLLELYLRVYEGLEEQEELAELTGTFDKMTEMADKEDGGLTLDDLRTMVTGAKNPTTHEDELVRMQQRREEKRLIEAELARLEAAGVGAKDSIYYPIETAAEDPADQYVQLADIQSMFPPDESATDPQRQQRAFVGDLMRDVERKHYKVLVQRLGRDETNSSFVLPGVEEKFALRDALLGNTKVLSFPGFTRATRGEGPGVYRSHMERSKTSYEIMPVKIGDRQTEYDAIVAQLILLEEEGVKAESSSRFPIKAGSRQSVASRGIYQKNLGESFARLGLDAALLLNDAMTFTERAAKDPLTHAFIENNKLYLEIVPRSTLSSYSKSCFYEHTYRRIFNESRRPHYQRFIVTNGEVYSILGLQGTAEYRRLVSLLRQEQEKDPSFNPDAFPKLNRSQIEPTLNGWKSTVIHLGLNSERIKELNRNEALLQWLVNPTDPASAYVEAVVSVVQSVKETFTELKEAVTGATEAVYSGVSNLLSFLF